MMGKPIYQICKQHIVYEKNAMVDIGTQIEREKKNPNVFWYLSSSRGFSKPKTATNERARGRISKHK